jgi:hypothetical protein
VLPAGSDRVGLLGQAAWLWTFAQPERTDVPKRGLFVREAFLCGEIPAFDASMVQPLSKDPALTMRQKLVQHQVDPSCTGCHALLDPIGLGLEGYDHLGLARTMEAGKPVDTSGRLVGSGDQDGAFRGLRELAEKLSKSRTVTRCFAATSLQYWLGRQLSEGDECGVSAMEKAYTDSGGDYVKALQALFTSESFLTKRP